MKLSNWEQMLCLLSYGMAANKFLNGGPEMFIGCISIAVFMTVTKKEQKWNQKESYLFPMLS